MSVEERRYALLKHTHAEFGEGGGSGGNSSVDTQVFTRDGTWTKPAGAKTVTIYAVGGGGGGGSGRRSDNNTSRGGGGGGEGSGRSGPLTLLADDLPSTVAVTIGLGGLGGGSIVVDNLSGVAGSDGGISSFGTYLRAIGGEGGNGGSTATATGGSGLGSGDQFMTSLVAQDGLNGGSGVLSATNADAQAHTTDTWSVQCGGGGGGGGISAANGLFSGGNSSELSARYTASYLAQGGADGIPGEAGINYRGYMGVGGGGGGGGPRAPGGNGAVPGGGGGGGGGSTSTTGPSASPSGAGGNGGDGVVVVVTNF